MGRHKFGWENASTRLLYRTFLSAVMINTRRAQSTVSRCQPWVRVLYCVQRINGASHGEEEVLSVVRFSLCPDSPSNSWGPGVWAGQTLSPYVDSGHRVSSETARRMMQTKAGSYVEGFSATATASLPISLLWNLSFRFFCRPDVRFPKQRVYHIILRILVVSLQAHGMKAKIP